MCETISVGGCTLSMLREKEVSQYDSHTLTHVYMYVHVWIFNISISDGTVLGDMGDRADPALCS